jgi:hypothetical protein
MANRVTNRAFMVAALLSMLAPARLAHAGVSVNIGINLPAPPPIVAVPGTPVMYAPSVDANYFAYGGQYYAFVGGAWYVSAAYGGPWAVVAPEFVPRPILAVPVRYYRVVPPGWRGWRREAPPHWEARWGRHWTERRVRPERARRHERFR